MGSGFRNPKVSNPTNNLKVKKFFKVEKFLRFKNSKLEILRLKILWFSNFSEFEKFF